MTSTLPQIIASHVQVSLASPTLTLLTSALQTPANWLVVRFIQEALRAPSQSQQAGLSAQNARVVVVSLWRSLDLWTELLKKNGTDVDALLTSKRMIYIDGLPSQTPSPATSQDRVLHLKMMTVVELLNTINSAMQRSQTIDHTKSILIIDGLDLLLAMQAEPSANAVSQFVVEMQTKFTNVIISCAADSPLLHNTDSAATPSEVQHSTLIRSLAHSSTLVYQLRPLETGHAKEVSGSLRISKGGAYADVEIPLNDGEWLYLVSGDGSVKVWGRGES